MNELTNEQANYEFTNQRRTSARYHKDKCQMSMSAPCVGELWVEGAGGIRNVWPCRMQQRRVQFSHVPWKWWW